MLNKTILLGRLAQDPTVRTTQSGISVATFDLAVQVPSKDKDRSTPPDWLPIVCWRETADFAGRYLTKGRQIVVEGRLSSRKYTAQDGSNRKVVEVIASHIYFADSGSGGNQSGAQTAPAAPAQNEGFGGGFTEVPDDELPF